MKHIESDYLIVRVGNKNMLVLATGKTVGILVNTMMNKEVETIKFSPDTDLLCVLGPDPEPGSSAFGCTVRPVHDMGEISGMPKLVCLGRPEDIKKTSRKALKRLPKIIDKYRLKEAVRRCTRISFVQQSGTKTHTFRSKFRKEEWADEINIFLDQDNVIEDVYQRLLIALGESVYTHLVATSRKAKWIVLFNKLRNVHRLDKATLADLLQDFLQSGDAKDVKNVVSEDMLPFVDLIFRTIARQRQVSVRELELLAEAKPEAVADMWPGEIEVVEGRPDMDKAVLKSPQTLFAHTFARHVNGVDVGKTLRKAMKNSLKEIA